MGNETDFRFYTSCSFDKYRIKYEMKECFPYLKKFGSNVIKTKEESLQISKTHETLSYSKLIIIYLINCSRLETLPTISEIEYWKEGDEN